MDRIRNGSYAVYRKRLSAVARIRILKKRLALLAALTGLALFTAGVQSAERDVATRPDSAAHESEVAAAKSSGNWMVLDGPDGVTETLEAAEDPDAIRERISWTESYWNWKASLKEDHGFSFGLIAATFYQQANEVLPGEEDDAFGGIYRFQGAWELFGRGTGHMGRLEWRIEKRANIGNFQTPSELGRAVGAAALNPGYAWSNMSTDFSTLNWTQHFNEGRGAMAVGRLVPAAYLDKYPNTSFWGGFANQAFFINPTLGLSGVGALGAVVKSFITETVSIGGHIYDGNAVNGEFDFDTIEEGEFLYAGEVAWTPSIEHWGKTSLQLTVWFKDEREKAGVASGQGWAFTGYSKASERWAPFLRLGYSDGGGGVYAEKSVAIGTEYTVRKDQKWAVGAGWAKPSEERYGSGLRDEYVLETSYRMQLFPSIAIIPDVQLLIHPAENPDVSTAWVLGLKLHVSI